ncbi:MAG: hypothetical protein U0835_16625 [Isosphaeraceae bacterium]
MGITDPSVSDGLGADLARALARLDPDGLPDGRAFPGGHPRVWLKVFIGCADEFFQLFR